MSTTHTKTYQQTNRHRWLLSTHLSTSINNFVGLSKRQVSSSFSHKRVKHSCAHRPLSVLRIKYYYNALVQIKPNGFMRFSVCFYYCNCCYCPKFLFIYWRLLFYCPFTDLFGFAHATGLPCALRALLLWLLLGCKDSLISLAYICIIYCWWLKRSYACVWPSLQVVSRQESLLVSIMLLCLYAFSLSYMKSYILYVCYFRIFLVVAKYFLSDILAFLALDVLFKE